MADVPEAGVDRAGVTQDAVLGGRLTLLQPRRGHRAGHDAILLAAAVAAQGGAHAVGGHAVDLGAGVGTAGLALAARVPGLRVTLVEIDPVLAALASRNVALNRLEDRAVALTLDAGAPARSFVAAALPGGSVDWVLMNPPFNTAAHQASADKARAHVAPDDLLPVWLKTASRLLRPNGRVVLIHRADGLASVLKALVDFGGVAVLPVYPKPRAAAIRVLVGAIKGSRTPLSVLPGLTLADAMGRPTAEAELILREAQPLPLW